MNFKEFTSHLSNIENATLGGLESQFRLAPKMRLKYSQDKIEAAQPKEAAVLALFYPNNNNETHFLLTLRASYKGTHSAQISFPGGKTEQSDIDKQHTSKREAFEEVGIKQENIHIVKQLTDAYIPPSNFLVTPFMGILDYAPTFTKNHEVETIIEVKLSHLLDDSNIIIQNMSTSYMNEIDVPCFKLNNYIVWGATAMILSEIKDLIKSVNSI